MRAQVAAIPKVVQCLLDNRDHEAIVRLGQTERLSALLRQLQQPQGFFGWHIALASWA
jgi:hypothetical protein